MMYLITTFSYWLLLALALGVLIGWITCGRGGDGFWRGVTPWLLLMGLGALVSLAQLLPQRPGLWFDLGMLMLTGYFAGCCLGCLLGKMFGRRLGEMNPSGALAASSRPVTRVMIREKERAVDPQLKPLAAAAAAPEEAVVGLSAPRAGKPDDLTKIYGIDEETQRKLNGLGIYHYDQLATLTPGNRRWVFRNLGHEGRFPSWWWRWRYDAEKLMGEPGGAATPVALAGTTPDEAAAPKAKTRTKAKPKAEAEGAPVSSAPASETGADSASAPVAAAAPEATAPAVSAASAPVSAAAGTGTRPPALDAPRGGKGDDLKRIRGIGKQNEGRLHGLGIWHFDQIAGWSAEQVRWVGDFLAFPGRIEREDWVAQAKVLATGGETEFSKRADAGKVATSRDTGDDGQSNIAVPGKDFDPKKPGKA
jgi:predicted flap endonuclease-1-like 5' DNA nuclease